MGATTSAPVPSRWPGHADRVHAVPALVTDELARRAAATRASSDDDEPGDAASLAAALARDGALLRAAVAALTRVVGGGDAPADGEPAPPPPSAFAQPATAPAVVPLAPQPLSPPSRLPPPPRPPGDVATPAVAAWLGAHDPDAARVADAAAAGASRDAAAALDALCARERVTAAALAPHAAALGFHAPSVVERAAELAAVQAALVDEAGYVVARDGADLAVLYRHAPGTPCHAVKFETLLDAPLVHVLALCAEVDLFPAWNKFAVQVKIVGREPRDGGASDSDADADADGGAAPASLIQGAPTPAAAARPRPPRAVFAYAASWVPPPFPQFDLTIRVRGHDGGDGAASGGLILAMESVDGVAGAGLAPPADPAAAAAVAAKPPAAARRHTTLLARGSCIRLVPVAPAAPGGRPRTHATLAVSLDPRLPFVPGWLVAWVLRVLSPAIVRAVRTVMEVWCDDGGGDDGAAGARPKHRSPHAGKLTARIRARAPQYAAVQALVDARVAARGGVLPDPPPPRAAAVAAAAGRGGGLLRRASSTAADAVEALARGSITLMRRFSSTGVASDA